MYKSKILIMSLVAILFQYCAESNGPNNDNITISGKVVIENESDYSNVIVNLYTPVGSDTSLSRINNEFGQIGAQDLVLVEFDHRNNNPIHSTSTNEKGDWTIEIDKESEYIIVIEKQGWGWYYSLLSDNSYHSTTLYKEIQLDGIIEQNYSFEDGRTYSISNQCIFKIRFN